jgi:hypothetical protein
MKGPAALGFGLCLLCRRALIPTYPVRDGNLSAAPSRKMAPTMML